MSKFRYNLLRIALGAFLAATIIIAFKEPESLSRAQWVALGLGLLAAVANYWPEPKNTKREDRA